MSRIPSFSDFKMYESLIETSDQDLILKLNSLETGDPYHTVNEGAFMDAVKNKLSKFFLGPLSRVGMIDKARKILVDLEIELVETRHKFEKELESIQDQMDAIKKDEGDKEILKGLVKSYDAKTKEAEAFEKSQAIKIKKSLDFIQDAIEGNERRRKYYEAARSEDEVALAELEYKLAKERSGEHSLKKYEDKIKEARRKASEKTDQFQSDVEKKEGKEDKSGGKKDGTAGTEKVERVDPESEKKKIAKRKATDIVKRKKELAIEIADLEYDLEMSLKDLLKRLKKAPPPGSKYMESKKMYLLELASALDAKKNLLKLLKSLGKETSEIENKLEKESTFTKLTNSINKAISDGYDAKTGNKKILGDAFAPSSAHPSGINPENLKDAISRIN